MMFIALLCVILPTFSGQAASPPHYPVPVREDLGEGLKVISTQQGRPFVIYVDAPDGHDVGEQIVRALDLLSGSGGTIQLPPGEFHIHATLNLGGSRSKGGPRGVVLTGTGGAGSTRLVWQGPEWAPMIDLPSPWGCQVRNLALDGNNTAGVIGIRYRGGYEREANSGKNNQFENLKLVNLHVGIEVGDPMGPDLVSGHFHRISIANMGIGVRVMAMNVTGMVFRHIQLTSYRQAGFHLIGFGGRQIRVTAEDPVAENVQVLMDPDQRHEIFLNDIPAYARKRMVWPHPDYGHVAGGGAPDVTIHALIGGSDHPEAWMIDSNFAAVRVYGAQVETAGGFFRRSYTGISGRFNDVLVDVSVSTTGPKRRNAIEYHGRGPLFLVGGTYEGDLALLGQVIVYNMGVRFFPQDKGGFTQLPQTAGSGANVHEMLPLQTLDLSVPGGVTSLPVRFDGTYIQPDAHYQVFITPGFNAGHFWVTRKTREGFELHFNKGPAADTHVDVLVRRKPDRLQ